MATELFIPIPGNHIPHYTGGIQQTSPYFWKKDRFIRVCDSSTSKGNDSTIKMMSITIKGSEITEQDLEVLDIFKRQLRLLDWKQYITPTRVELNITFRKTTPTVDQLTNTLLEIYKGYNLLGKQFTQIDLSNMHHVMQSYYVSSQPLDSGSIQFNSSTSYENFINAPSVYVIPTNKEN